MHRCTEALADTLDIYIIVPVQPKTKKVRGQGKHSMCEYNLHVNALNITVSYSIGLGPSNEKRFEPDHDHKRRKKGWSQNQYTL